jgi:uncharacterized protein
MRVVAIIAFLILYNNLLNLWPPFNGWLYVPLNVTLAFVLLIVGMAVMGLEPRLLGLHGDHLGGAVMGFASAAVVVAPAFLLALAPSTAHLVADRRVARLNGPSLAYQVLIRIPFGTALAEEVAFRAVLLGALVPRGKFAAVVGSSLAFGLWHVIPTRNLIRENRPDASLPATASAVCGGVVVTTLAGVAFAWMRIRTQSLASPWALHATLNALATVAAVLAHRTLQLTTSGEPRRLRACRTRSAVEDDTR